MADEIAQLSSRGTVTLPASLRRQLGLAEGDVFTVKLLDGAVVLTPVVLTEVERYTDARVQGFTEAAEMLPQELAEARRAWSSDTTP